MCFISSFSQAVWVNLIALGSFLASFCAFVLFKAACHVIAIVIGTSIWNSKSIVAQMMENDPTSEIYDIECMYEIINSLQQLLDVAIIFRCCSRTIKSRDWNNSKFDYFLSFSKILKNYEKIVQCFPNFDTMKLISEKISKNSKKRIKKMNHEKKKKCLEMSL